MGFKFSLPLNMPFFQKKEAKQEIAPTVNRTKANSDYTHLNSNVALLLDDEAGILRSIKRAPTRKPEKNLPKPTDGVLGTQIAEIMNGTAESLARSCLYFSPENLAILGSGPDVTVMLARMDPLVRATLIDGTMRAEQSVNFRAIAGCTGDLTAGVEAARLAAQIFRLLRSGHTPLSVLAPLKKVTDSAQRTLRTAASAISASDEATARMAVKALTETEEVGREMTEIIPTMTDFHSLVICRLMFAALFAILVSTKSMVEVSANLLIPRLEKIEILQLESL